MKVTMFSAMSLNSIIAKKDYSEDFLHDENWKEFVRLANKIGCIVVGRKTYEVVKKDSVYNFDNLKCRKIVVSRKKRKLHKDYVCVNSPKDAVKKAKEIGIKQILVAGGGKTNRSFLDAGLVDELIVNIEPVLVGKGIFAFSESRKDVRLKLIGVKKLNASIVQLRYSLRRK